MTSAERPERRKQLLTLALECVELYADLLGVALPEDDGGLGWLEEEVSPDPDLHPMHYAHWLAGQVVLRAHQLGVRSPSKKARIPADTRWGVWERDNFTCQHCGCRRNLAVDHIHPESRGGGLELANLQTLCRSCNSKKGAR